MQFFLQKLMLCSHATMCYNGLGACARMRMMYKIKQEGKLVL